MEKTIRQDMMTLLASEALSTRELAQAVGIREKEIVDHMGHIARSVAASGRQLSITPCRCRQCDFVFKERRRFSTPSRCPRCKNTYLEPPLFKIT